MFQKYQSVTTPHRCCGRYNGRNLKCLLFSLHCSGQEEIRPTIERKLVDSALALGHSTVSGCKETKCLLFSSPPSGPHSVVQSHWLRPGKLHTQLHVQHGYLGTTHWTSAMVFGELTTSIITSTTVTMVTPVYRWNRRNWCVVTTTGRNSDVTRKWARTVGGQVYTARVGCESALLLALLSLLVTRTRPTHSATRI